AVLGAVAVDRSASPFIPRAVTPLYVTYRTYQAYAGRLEDERRHREIIQSLNEGMFVVTHAGVVGLWKDAIARITGIGRQDVLNRELFKAVPAFVNAGIGPAVTATLQGGAACELERVEFIAAAGRRIL